MGTASAWEQFRNFPRLLQPPYSFNPRSLPVTLKILPYHSYNLLLSPHLLRRFFWCRLENGMYQICLRRHRPKGVSAGAAGAQLLQKPALEAQVNPNSVSWLHRPNILTKRPYSFPSLKLISLPSYHLKSPLRSHLTSVSTNLRGKLIF